MESYQKEIETNASEDVYDFEGLMLLGDCQRMFFLSWRRKVFEGIQSLMRLPLIVSYDAGSELICTNCDHHAPPGDAQPDEE